MLEVLFSDSAAGSLQCAMGHGSQIGGCLGIIATDESGRLLAPEETARLQREAEERMRRNWAEAIPMEGSPQDILSFPLSLGMGPIDEDGIGPLRENALEPAALHLSRGAANGRCTRDLGPTASGHPVGPGTEGAGAVLGGSHPRCCLWTVLGSGAVAAPGLGTVGSAGGGFVPSGVRQGGAFRRTLCR